MKRLMTVLALVLGVVAFAHAQKTTERFIPLGQSPGVSGKTTVIGTIGTVDAAAKSLAVQSDAGPQRFTVTDATRIWLDRSAARQSTQTGTWADLRPGRRVEVKFPDGDGAPRTSAEWIKVDAAAP
jgi:hypothetical protein